MRKVVLISNRKFPSISLEVMNENLETSHELKTLHQNIANNNINSEIFICVQPLMFKFSQVTFKVSFICTAPMLKTSTNMNKFTKVQI